MSISDKLTTIANNMQKVYDAGNVLSRTTSWNRMFFEGARNDLLPYIKYKDTSNVTTMGYAFQGNKTVTEIPETDTSKVTDFSYYCYNATNLAVIPNLDYSQGTRFNYAFSSCKKVKTVPDMDLRNATTVTRMFDSCEGITSVGALHTDNCTDFSGMFYWCNWVQTIKSINLTNATNVSNMFYKCVNLKRITYEGSINKSLSLSDSTLLEHESIMNTINALVDRSDTTALTLTLGSSNLAKLTDEEKVIATEKGWTLA